MSLSVWDLFKYFFKWKWLIALFTVICFFFASWYVDKKQTYNAKIIIQYNDKCISNGKNLKGEDFDPNEIKSPSVVLNVLKDLGKESQRIEAVREKISINAITPTTVENIKSAKEKLGEEYRFYPNSFSIIYKGNSSFESTRDTLSSIIANYYKYYSETYLYLATLNEVDYSLNERDFDYIEQVEQIRDNLKQTIAYLGNYSKDSSGYRSPTTGLTFDDLLKDFQRINDYSISNIFSKIYEGQITLDKDLLIAKYRERIEDNNREVSLYNYKASVAKSKMDAYANANEVAEAALENVHTDNESNTQILQGVERDREGIVDEQTTYDNLLINYASDSISANNKAIDARYCEEVIERFTRPLYEYVDYEASEAEVKKEIANTLNELSELYKKANINISDYNSYIPAMHIKKLSGVGYYENLSDKLYKVIAIIGGFGMSTVVAIAYEIIKKYSLVNAGKDDKDGDEDEDENDETV